MAVNIYDVQLTMILTEKPDSEGKQTGAIQVFSPIRSLEFEPGNNHYKALIGRDILGQGV